MNEGLAAFFGAVIGSGLLLFRDWIATAFTTRKNAKYLAIRVITILDRFVDECAVASMDDGFLEGWNEYAKATTNDPAPVVFPDDLDWRSIDHQLAYNLLALDNKIHDAKQSISAAGEHATPPDYEEYYSERRLQYAVLGLEVAELARILRDTHDLPRRSFGEWNPIARLTETRDEITLERKRWRAEAAASAQDIFV